MKSKEEKNKDRNAMLISLGIHAVVAVLFFFLLAWREPNPPIPEYGIELNFGLDSSGSGDTQTPNPPTDQTDDVSTEVESDEIEPTEDVVESTESKETAVEATEATIEEALPDVVSPDVRPAEKVVKPVENKVEQKKEVISNNPKPTTDPVKQPTKVEGDPADKSKIANGNQGDDVDKTGDKGDPQGSIDARAMYGTAGAGGGASLDLAGWNWDELPKPKDTSNETGRIVFQITIDDEGYIIGITTLESTVNPSIEKIYRDEVSRLSFSKKNDGSARVAQTTKGKITFILKNK
jgi:outer membrane biosynthesis protein TonB